MAKIKSKINQLRVWHIPQVPGAPFHVLVDSVEEGVKIMDILAEYDAFQLEHNIKPDYANINGLEIYQDDGDGPNWYTWCNDETDDPREWLELQVK